MDLVQIMNEEMAKELRTAIIKFYKIKYFHDFTNYALSMEEVSTASKIYYAHKETNVVGRSR